MREKAQKEWGENKGENRGDLDMSEAGDLDMSRADGVGVGREENIDNAEAPEGDIRAHARGGDRKEAFEKAVNRGRGRPRKIAEMYSQGMCAPILHYQHLHVIETPYFGGTPPMQREFRCWNEQLELRRGSYSKFMQALLLLLQERKFHPDTQGLPTNSRPAFRQGSTVS